MKQTEIKALALSEVEVLKQKLLSDKDEALLLQHDELYDAGLIDHATREEWRVRFRESVGRFAKEVEKQRA